MDGISWASLIIHVPLVVPVGMLKVERKAKLNDLGMVQLVYALALLCRALLSGVYGLESASWALGLVLWILVDLLASVYSTNHFCSHLVKRVSQIMHLLKELGSAMSEMAKEYNDDLIA